MILEDIIYYDADARGKLLAGINKIADAVAATMGPGGKNVVLGGSDGKPLVTKDGVTVASYLTLVDSIENMGAELIRQAASNTVTDAGDGTTTSTVLAREFAREFIDKCNYEYKRGIEEASKQVIERLKDYVIGCKDLESLTDIAKTSANGDEFLAGLVAKAALQAGPDGYIEVRETKSKDTTLTTYEGYKMDMGWINTNFVNNDKNVSCDLNKTLVLIVDGKVEKFDYIIGIYMTCKEQNAALLIVAEDFSEEVIHNSVKNFQMGNLITLVKSENFGTYKKFSLEDLSIFTDGRVASPKDVKDMKVKLGIAAKVEVFQNYTMIQISDEAPKDAIDKRIELIKNISYEAENAHDIEKLDKRISQLSAGYSVLKIGGYTEAETRERFDRAEDAVGATQAALKDGILPGGGSALYKISLNEERMVSEGDFGAGYNAVFDCLKAPFAQIVKNAGIELEGNIDTDDLFQGLDVSTNTVCDLVEKGITDPVKVTVSAFNNALSVAVLIASTGATLQNTFVER